jgi:hypothetical protein
VKIIAIEHFTEGEDELVKVPLVRSEKTAILLEADFDDLMSLGISPRWKLYHGQVICRNNGRNITIARLIRHAAAGGRVDNRDGDPTNLRRSNLVLRPGPSKYSARHDLKMHYKNTVQLEHIYA